MATEYQRMVDGTHTPIEQEMADFIGEPAKGAWVKLRRFLKENYDIVPEMIFDKKHGWDVRYRKSGRTLITLTPEKGAVRILIVLGGEESEKALSMRDELSPKMCELIENTRQLHDGRWLWIRLFQTKDAEDVEKLLPVKRKPKKARLLNQDRSISEAYERVKEDMEITETHVIVDFHQRKKHGETVTPLKIPRKFYGVEEYLIPCLSKPKRAKPKTLYTYETREKKLLTHSEKVEARWLFTHVGSTTAWRICKKVLGEEFYAHYLRLRKLSKIGMNREKGSITHLKAISGIKSLRALEAYIGYDEEAQDEAMEISE